MADAGPPSDSGGRVELAQYRRSPRANTRAASAATIPNARWLTL